MSEAALPEGAAAGLDIALRVLEQAHAEAGIGPEQLRAGRIWISAAIGRLRWIKEGRRPADTQEPLAMFETYRLTTKAEATEAVNGGEAS